VSGVSDLAVAPVGESDRAGALATLVSAFTGDPVMRWLYPQLQQYLTDFRLLLEAFGGKAFDEGTAWGLGELSAVALWIPPGTEPDADDVVDVFTDTVAPAQHEDLFAVLDQMDASHPKDLHWYLPWFGVDAALQGRGLGSELMVSCLEVVDADRLPAYLETPNPRNIPFYERHGFEVTGVARAGACPPVAFMRRAAR
jgi:ribosomal protein S18 acetylase RimI-like enzyme